MARWSGARLLVLIVGVVLFAIGLASVAAGPASASSGIYPLGIGIALVIGAVIERARYRSAAAVLTAERHGPGGGEPVGEPLDARFRPTDERFEDPTTRQRMRVWTDPNSGERRYVAEE